MSLESLHAMTEPIDRRQLLIGGLMAASAGLVFARQPKEQIDYLGQGKLETLIPKSFGRWEFATTSGLVIPTEDALSDALYSQLLTRVYTDNVAPPVMLLAAQSSGQTGILQLHRPEVCYPAGGYSLSTVTQRVIKTDQGPIRANQLTATIPGRNEQVLYWTRVGNAMPTSWAQQRWAVARDNLQGRIPDAVLVRVSTVDLDEASAYVRLHEFIQSMLSAVPANSRRVLAV
jgi:EpsI family protein